jgi:hypothetical protein
VLFDSLSSSLPRARPFLLRRSPRAPPLPAAVIDAIDLKQLAIARAVLARCWTRVHSSNALQQPDSIGTGNAIRIME